jgi:hypothetical protein
MKRESLEGWCMEAAPERMRRPSVLPQRPSVAESGATLRRGAAAAGSSERPDCGCMRRGRVFGSSGGMIKGWRAGIRRGNFKTDTPSGEGGAWAVLLLIVRADPPDGGREHGAACCSASMLGGRQRGRRRDGEGLAAPCWGCTLIRSGRPQPFPEPFSE